MYIFRCGVCKTKRRLPKKESDIFFNPKRKKNVACKKCGNEKGNSVEDTELSRRFSEMFFGRA
jgi:hypothetical protein